MCEPIGREANATGRVSLGVPIDEQRWLLGRRQARGEIDCGRGLAYAALLIGDSDDARH